MAVPSSNSHLRNTAGGAFTAQTQGGTLLGNGTTGDVITNALRLQDATDADIRVPYPVALSNGLYGIEAPYSAGTFAYYADGQYVIRGSSTTLSGVASTEVKIPGSENVNRRSIHDFQHDFGVGLLAKWRANEFSWLGRLDNGNVIPSRTNWLNAAGTALGLPTTLTGVFMYDLADSDATDKAVDSASTPSRAVPGELVMKVDFVDLSVATGGDFYDYAAITGM